MREKILIVDDDKSICEILEFNLKSEGYHIETAYSAEEALKKDLKNFSLILLDVMMGGISGYKMAEQLREHEHAIPIIFLTAKDTENDMLTGFSVGGDDYISKPFSIKEVTARIRAVIGRAKSASVERDKNQKIELGELVIDPEIKEVSVNSEQTHLTRKEFEILLLLAQSPQRIFSRSQIIDRVWGESGYVTERTVDVHVARLRKKLRVQGNAIKNRAGFGYRFDDEYNV